MSQLRNSITAVIRRTLKRIRALSNIPKQQKIARKMDGYIESFLQGHIEKFTATPKKTEYVGQKIFWQYWRQGVDADTSKIVTECLRSVEKYRGEYNRILLTDATVRDYVEIPDFVWKRVGKDGFNTAMLTDLIRLYLLAAYGGVWLDATVYLTANINQKILTAPFFAFQRTQNPPPDANLFRRFDPLYFSWNPKFSVRMLNSFIVAEKNHPIITDLLSILLEYWKHEKTAGHYFIFQICFNRMMLYNRWKKLNADVTGDVDCHQLQRVALEPFNRTVYNEIVAKTDVHKLTYRFDRLHQIPEGSFFDYIARQKINEP